VTGFGRRRGKRSAPLAEINITPFTDVVLVLLVVFMVSASFLGTGKNGLNVNLPAARAAEAQPKQDLEITLRADNALYLGRDRISIRDLPAALKARRRVANIDMVIIQADQRVLYDRIVQVMDAVKLAGLDKIALATEPGGGRRLAR
jgi:biopolymer transport protein TolR